LKKKLIDFIINLLSLFKAIFDINPKERDGEG
jgi:hypothetical protein